MSDVNEIAKQLVGGVRQRCNDLLTLPDEWSELEDRIASALASERAKFAAFADEKGEPRKVLGTLALTVEGDIVGNGAKLFSVDDDELREVVAVVCEWTLDTRHDAYHAGYPCGYSTRESATSALDAAKEQP